MRVVNDRRRLPRVAWNGHAVIQTRRGEVRGVGLDLSADGMAVLAASPGKAKERVRVHMQLGEFPLLTDARVVRMTKRRDGYRWALRFDRLDERMRANLEAYVRAHLASGARVRQAQLYAQRLKGGTLPAPPSATPPPSNFIPTPAGVPTPAPVDPRIRAGITLPPIEPKDLDVPVSPEPTEVSLDGLSEVLPQRPLEIELPSEAPGPDQPVLDIADAPPSKQEVYVPYQSSSATEEAALLGEGPLTPAPDNHPTAFVATPSPVRDVDPNPAEVLAPGVIEISDDEELSLEDILAEVEAGGTFVPGAGSQAPVSDLQMPPRPDPAKVPTQGLGDVPVLDDDLGDEEETLARDSAPAAPTVVKEGGASLLGAPVDDALALEDAPLALSEAPLEESPTLDGGLLEDAAVLVGAPVGEAPTLDAAPLGEAPTLDGAPLDGAPLDEAPLGEAPFGAGPTPDEAPALAGAPFSDVPPPSALSTLFPGAVEPVSEHSPHEFGGAPFNSTPDIGEDSAEISLADLAPAMQRAAVHATEIATEAASQNPYATPPPSSPQPYIPVSSSNTPMAPLVRPEADEPLPSSVPTPGMVAMSPLVGPADAVEDDEEDFPEPPALLDSVDSAEPAAPLSSRPLYADDAEPFDPYAPNTAPAAGAAPSRMGSAPRALGELPPVVEGLYTPTSNPEIDEGSGAYNSASFEPFLSAEAGLYGGREDVTFQEQQGNPRQRLAVLQQDDKSTHKLAQQHDLFLGDIVGVTSGGASYARPGAAPADTDAEDERSAPRTDVEELDFAELEEVEDAAHDESGPPPAARDSGVDRLAAVKAEAEQLQAAIPGKELGAHAPISMHGLPEPAEAAPTRPIDVDGPEGFTPEPRDLTPPPQDLADHTPAPQELSLDDVEGSKDGDASASSNRGIPPTYPEFNVIPDYDQPVGPETPSGPEPAQSGHTIVASFEDLGLPAPSADPAGAVAPSAPGDFAVVPSFGGPQIGAGFTMVASFDAEAEANVSGSSTIIATAGDIEAWRSAGVASAEPPGASDAVIPPEFDEEQTGTYTPAPGSLPPLGPLPQAPPVGAPGLQDEALTAMRVGRGAHPTGAGFELNPRGPAPVPVPSASTVAVTVGPPGPSSRGQTSHDKGGRPGPPPKPAASVPPPKPDPSVAPPLRGSGSVAPAVPAVPRRSLVEDALAELKRKTDSRRKKRDTLSPIEEKAKALAEEKKAVKQERRRRRLGNAELVDPAIADLYKAAMTDLSRSRD